MDIQGQKKKVKPLVGICVIAMIGLAVFLLIARYHLTAIGEFFGKGAQESINTTFSEYITSIKATGSGKLEVATHESMAVFSRTHEKTYVWGAIPGGITSVEIKVPVTYRYHIQLDDPWRIEINGNKCTVYAPAIRPSLPPAIHTDKMQKRLDESWIRFDGRKLLDELEMGITPELNKRAQRNISLIKEPSRKVVATFIKNWLLQEERWSDRFHWVEVIFAGEEPSEGEAIPKIEISERIQINE